MIRSNRNRLFETLFSMYVSRILKTHFHTIHVSGEHLIHERDPSLPTIVYANHSNWWDGFVMLAFARRRWKIDSHLMMDIEQMRRYWFFKWLGVFSVDRHSPRSAVESIDHAVELLAGTRNILWIFPQGVLLPNDVRPIRFYQGVSRIIQKLGNVNLLCMALRYEYGKEQLPEVYARFRHLQRIDAVPDAASLTEAMRERMERDVEALRVDIAGGVTDDFVPILRGKRSRNAAIDDLHGMRIAP